jgi:hypothetical protein
MKQRSKSSSNMMVADYWVAANDQGWREGVGGWWWWEVAVPDSDDDAQWAVMIVVVVLRTSR